jgi:excisionase family DNA binding protein
MYDPNELLRKTKLRREEAAFLLEVSQRTVDRYMTAGKLEFKSTPGGQRRPLTESVKKYL